MNKKLIFLTLPVTFILAITLFSCDSSSSQTGLSTPANTEVQSKGSDDIQVGSAGDPCVEGICSSVNLVNSSQPIYYDCCDFMVINGKRETLENTGKYSGRHLSLRNDEWEVFIDFKQLDNSAPMGESNMRGEMMITNRLTKQSKNFKVEGAIILD